MSAKDQTLFSVTLPWHARDPEQGTYASTVWAPDDGDAGMKVALEMADSRCSGANTEEEKREWAVRLLEQADLSQVVVLRVEDTIRHDLRELIAGPSGVFGAAEKERLDQVLELLGIARPEAQAPRPRG
jgi:hypothetical protein